MENEIWKDVPDYEGLYQVSNLGRVKSLERTRKGNGGSICKVKEKLLSLKIDKYGYVCYTLCKDGRLFYFTAHRLVALAFIDNPNPYSFNQINHIDGNKRNNTSQNLEWCDAKHNQNEAVRLGLRGGKPYKPRVDSSKIDQIDLIGNLIKRYDNLAQAERENGISKTAICNCLNRRSKTSSGFFWKYAK